MDVKDLISRARLELITAGPDLLQQLHRLVTDSLQMSVAPRIDVLEAVVEVATDRGVRSVVVEHEYVDADYLQTFGQHYSKAFRPPSSFCKRLHFFAAPITETGLFALSDTQLKSYLGYCVLRPTGHQFIGRTVLVPPAAALRGDGLFHSNSEFPAHLVGQRLTVTGMPFIQQDLNTFVCAGAALWSVGLFLHKRLGTPRYFPGEITEMALRHFSAAQLRQGLTVAQMVMTLRDMGLNPQVESYLGLQRLKNTNAAAHAAIIGRVCDFISVFADSGIPPILAFDTPQGGGHAVAIAGHDVAERPAPTAAPTDPLRSWEFVDRFFVMDDARGPYREFRVNASTPARAVADALDALDHVAVIAPVPPEVVTEYRDAHAEFGMLIPYWNIMMDGLAGGERKIIAGHDGAPVIRRVLIDSRHWKQCVIASGIPAWLKSIYQSMLLPKYIWVVELSAWAHFNKKNHRDRQLIGEALLDATANPMCPLQSVISMQARGLLLDLSDPNVPELYSSPEPFVPYAPVCKTS